MSSWQPRKSWACATCRARSSAASSVNGSGSRSLNHSPPACPQQACSDTSAGSKRRIARRTRCQVLRVDPVGGPQPESNAVQGQRVVSAGALERAHRRAAFVEIVFGMRLDPPDRGTWREAVVVEGPETDPGTCRNRSLRQTSGHEACHAVVTSPFCRRRPCRPSSRTRLSARTSTRRRALSVFAWPAQLCLALPQSFWPALATPEHFSLAAASSAEAVVAPNASRLPTAEAMAMVLRFMDYSAIVVGVANVSRVADPTPGFISRHREGNANTPASMR